MIDEELKTELNKTLAILAKRVNACKESLNNGDMKQYRHYVNEIRFWADAVVSDWFDNFIRFNDNV